MSKADVETLLPERCVKQFCRACIGLVVILRPSYSRQSATEAVAQKKTNEETRGHASDRNGQQKLGDLPQLSTQPIALCLLYPRGFINPDRFRLCRERIGIALVPYADKEIRD